MTQQDKKQESMEQTDNYLNRTVVFCFEMNFLKIRQIYNDDVSNCPATWIGYVILHTCRIIKHFCMQREYSYYFSCNK